MKKILTAIAVVLLMFSCKKNESQTSIAEKAADSITTAVYEKDSTGIATGDTTENSVDWNGTYTGTLPCASCPGIETKLTLNSDKTYVLESNYLEEKDGKFTDKGNFEFSKDSSFITLKDSKDPNETKIFFVGEGSVWMAENTTDRSMKEDYKLVKK